MLEHFCSILLCSFRIWASLESSLELRLMNEKEKNRQLMVVIVILSFEEESGTSFSPSQNSLKAKFESSKFLIILW